MVSDESPTPEVLYRDGLAVLRHVREAPPWMDYDPRAGAYVAPGHRLPELRTWAEERGLPEAGGGDPSAPRPERLEAPLYPRPTDPGRGGATGWS